MIGGHNPDHTYNYVDELRRNWQYNEARTSAMEKAVFGLFRSDFGSAGEDGAGHVISWSDIEETAAEFNRDTSPESDLTTKRKMLDDKLISLGFNKIPTYDCLNSKTHRNANLVDVSGNALEQRDYSGAILSTPTANQACK